MIATFFEVLGVVWVLSVLLMLTAIALAALQPTADDGDGEWPCGRPDCDVCSDDEPGQLPPAIEAAMQAALDRAAFGRHAADAERLSEIDNLERDWRL